MIKFKKKTYEKNEKNSEKVNERGKDSTLEKNGKEGMKEELETNNR